MAAQLRRRLIHCQGTKIALESCRSDPLTWEPGSLVGSLACRCSTKVTLSEDFFVVVPAKKVSGLLVDHVGTEHLVPHL